MQQVMLKIWTNYHIEIADIFSLSFGYCLFILFAPSLLLSFHCEIDMSQLQLFRKWLGYCQQG